MSGRVGYFPLFFNKGHIGVNIEILEHKGGDTEYSSTWQACTGSEFREAKLPVTHTLVSIDYASVTLYQSHGSK